MCLTLKIGDATQQKHPFKNAWFGFYHQHSKLSICPPQSLSYCQVQCVNMNTTLKGLVWMIESDL